MLITNSMGSGGHNTTLDDIDITSELALRPTRSPDHAAESRALVMLARQLARSPRTVLQSLADSALDLCRADSAGISILETGGGQSVFRWNATAGRYAPYVGGTMPRDFSPCGVVLDRNSFQLMADPVRYYPYIKDLPADIGEVLLIPFHRGETAIGTVWVVALKEGRRFDAEDVRIMTSLSQFASAAVESLVNLQRIETTSEEIRDARTRLNAALAAGSIATWTWDIVNDRVVADANLTRLFSISADDAASGNIKHYRRAIHPADRDRVVAAVSQAVEAVTDFHAEYRLILGDGQVRWVEARGKVESDHAGRAISLPGVIVDVTDRKRAEAELKKSEEFGRNAIESSSDCVKILDLEGSLLAMNANGCRLMEIDDVAPRLRQRWIDFWPAESRETARLALEAARAGEKASFRGLCPTAKGTEKWWDVAVTPIVNADRQVERILIVSRDITATKRAEALLTSQSEALRQADRRKDEFLAMLAHELRNPLGAISTGVQLVQRVQKPEMLAELSEMIQHQVEHLTRLIDDLLDVSRITQGKITLKKETLELTALVGRAVDLVRPTVESKRHELTVSIPDEPVRFVADPTRTEQILGNLLTNAAKYSRPNGSIRLSAASEGEEVVFRVCDDGVGISAEMLPQVFDLFTQVDATMDRSQGGLGIGLTMVRNLVEMHGGHVSAASGGKDQGSEFTVRLPVGKPEADVPKPVQSPSADDHGTGLVLVVDDNVETARLTARMLRHHGYEVETCHDGPEAIGRACRLKPDVILLDIGLPGMNGYELADRLRQEESCKTARLIAISGYSEEQACERSRAAGFLHHLRKPLDFGVLLAILQN